MKTLPLLPALLLVLLALGACGDRGPAPEPTEEATTTPDAPVVLLARDTPLGQGDLAPIFDGLPEGKTVVVFYRGPW